MTDRRAPNRYGVMSAIIRLVGILCISVAAVGCVEDAKVHQPMRVQRAGWDPTYWDVRLLSRQPDEYFWSQRGEPYPQPKPIVPGDPYDDPMTVGQMMNGMLLMRTNRDEYWQLMDSLLAHAEQANRVILIEHIVMGEGMNYEFFLVIQTGEGLYMYTTMEYPLPTPAPQYVGVCPAWGRASVEGPFEDLWSFLEELDVWESTPRILGYPVPDWLIHVYQRDGGKSVGYFLQGDPVDQDVVHEGHALRSILRTPSAPPESDVQFWGDTPAEQLENYRIYSKKSRVPRAIINGVLQLVTKQYESVYGPLEPLSDDDFIAAPDDEE
ncbi:hypothetical protein LCGC14_0226340 [marine sediment metagenome]|uniref:Uncharacterized protein n=1 Tax=marine sediment metagenome TaxID=412755 RepID=A0A0F9WWB0_9ZZZZ|nr:hypothetical protein [Phycisphaerae bacterium]HDZ44047.1 hypothetical protein [Phycisphaerae bacterium]